MPLFLRYGLIGGGLISVLLFAPYFIFGTRPEWMKIGEIVGYTSMLLCLTTTYFAMRQQAQRAGGIGFGAALAVGAGVSAVAGIAFGIATWVFYASVGDALPEALITYYGDQIRNSGATAAAIDSQLKELDAMRPFFYNRPLQGAVMAATVFVIGVIESVIGAFLVSRRRTGMATA